MSSLGSLFPTTLGKVQTNPGKCSLSGSPSQWEPAPPGPGGGQAHPGHSAAPSLSLCPPPSSSQEPELGTRGREAAERCLKGIGEGGRKSSHYLGVTVAQEGKGGSHDLGVTGSDSSGAKT